jgi:hypothetical protein
MPLGPPPRRKRAKPTVPGHLEDLLELALDALLGVHGG